MRLGVALERKLTGCTVTYPVQTLLCAKLPSLASLFYTLLLDSATQVGE